MIYTVGNTQSYMDAIEKYGEGEVFKFDRHDDDPGGCAFQSIADAQRFIRERGNPTWSVFGIDAQWGVDTTPSEDGWWHYLLRNAPLIVLRGQE